MATGSIRRLDDNAFRLLVESTSDYSIFMLDPAGHVISWNQGAQRIKGYTADEIIGKHFSIFYPPEAIATDWPARELEMAVRDGRFEDEGWRLRKDGSRFWANVIITALRDPHGTLVGFGKVSRDLSERRRGEQALRESEERLRLIIENTVDYAIFMLDPGGHVASWNPGAQRIKQYTADEIIGHHFSRFYPEEAKARNWPQTELEIAQREGRFEEEGWRLRKDGTPFWANVVITALRGPDGTLRGYAKITRDISDRKAAQERIEALTQTLERRVVELAATNRELQQKSAENEGFVYSVSHDLRTPLVNLQGFSHELRLTAEELKALLSEPGVPEEVRTQARTLITSGLEESLSFIGSAVQHLGRIIDGLLRLSRVGRVQYEFVPVDIRQVVGDIVGAMHGTVTAAAARIEYDALPPATGDRNAIGQIFANLIGNALKSLDPERPGLVRVWASGEQPPVYAVTDNGLGIPLEFQPRVFQAFQQGRRSRERGEGMGLAIVRRIVERHGGRIWFESQPGQGTTFYFTLAPSAPLTAIEGG